MGSLLLFVGLIGLLARGIQVTWVSEQGNTHFGEGFLVFATLAIMTWVGLSWFLALLGLLTGTNLLLTALSVLLTIMAWAKLKGYPQSRWGIEWRLSQSKFIDILPWVMFTILVAFALWRGSFLPTLNTDALFLSLPKADVYVAEAGINVFVPPTQEWMGHVSQPSTYEMLLASVMALTMNDHYTEWVATLSGAGFAVASWVLFRQWFKDKLIASIGLLLVLSSTVFLLHLSSDKADLTTNLVCLLMIHWTARSLQRPTSWNLGFALLSGLLLMGLKKSGWLVSPVFFLIIAFTAFRAREATSRIHQIAVLSGLFLGGLILLGGANHLYLWVYTGNPFGIYKVGEQAFSTSSFSLVDPFRFLGLVSLAPFISTVQTIRLPWSGIEWYWPQYNLFFSHFGYAFILILGTALASSLYSLKTHRAPPGAKESGTFSLLALLAFAMITTHRYSYDGGFNTMARFNLFLLPALLTLGLLPLLERALNLPFFRPWSRAGFFGCTALICGLSAVQANVHDLHAPLEYVTDLWRHPEKRRWIFVEPNRLPSRVDRIAGLKDVIAADLTNHTWLHPLWGEYLSRQVLVISWQGDHALIPDEARWVVADNVSGGIWGGGLKVRSAADFAKARGWGLPTERDTALYRQLRSDPHWVALLASPSGEQCLFQRRPTK